MQITITEEGYRMPLVPAICTQCYAQIKVDSSKEAAICEHCGTAFIVDKAINNYNTTVNNNFHGATVHMHVESELDKLLRAAQTFENLGEYYTALTTYKKVCDNFPQEIKGWLGQMNTVFWGKYDKMDVSDLDNVEEIINGSIFSDSFKYACALATHIKREEIINHKNEFIRLFEENRVQSIPNLSKLLQIVGNQTFHSNGYYNGITEKHEGIDEYLFSYNEYIYISGGIRIYDIQKDGTMLFEIVPGTYTNNYSHIKFYKISSDYKVVELVIDGQKAKFRYENQTNDFFIKKELEREKGAKKKHWWNS